jgi:hypothetical protein
MKQILYPDLFAFQYNHKAALFEQLVEEVRGDTNPEAGRAVVKLV